MQVKGTVSKIRYRNEESGWTVCVLSTPDGDLPCVGTFFALSEGEDMAFEGDLVYHPKYGEQLSVRKFQKIEPTTTEQLERYLASDAIPHIGPKRAHQLVEEYGTNVLTILREEPSILLQLRGIGPVKAAEIQEALIAQEASQQTMLYLQGLGIGPRTAQEIYRVYGQDAKEQIEKDPYALVDQVEGIGFLTADAIAQKTGVQKDSLQRTKAGIAYLCERAALSDGACYLTDKELDRGLEKLLGEVPSSKEEACFDLILKQRLVRDTKTHRLYLRRLDTAEHEVAQRLVTLLEEPREPLSVDLEALQRAIGLTADAQQQAAIAEAAASPVLVITGGPGTGKTTIVRAVLELFDENHLATALAAPTGRAAKRLEQSTDREALTIHRLLGYRGGEETSLPERNAENPLDADAVIVDEVSMVDLQLMAHLTSALSDTARLVLVGDTDQLPSVGAGNVLHDLIASGIIPTVRLEHIYRQSERSSIVQNAHRVRRGQAPVANEDAGDFFFLPTRNVRDAADLIEDLVTRRLPAYYGFSPFEDIQVLSAMKKGECGVITLNERLQRALNPPREGKNEIEVGDHLFREGDRVMQIKNDYDLPWKLHGDEGEGVYNGDFGVLTAIDPDGDAMTVDYDGRLAHYEPKQFRELDLSYAITIHKSQGSEFPCVVIAIVPGAPMLLTRNILYTAMTRARNLCICVGDAATLQRMVENNHARRRNASLDERLRDALTRYREI